MRWTWARTAVVTLLGAASVLASPGPPPDPLALFTPDGFLSAKRRARIDAGAAVVDVLPARDGEIAVFGAARIRVGTARLLAWMRQIDALQQGRYVPVVERFSDPPRIEDLERLRLDTADLESIRRCRPGDCDLKLSKADINRLQQRISLSGAGWQPSVQAEFRQIMLERATTYLARGTDGLPATDDRKRSVAAGAELDEVLSGLNGSFAEPVVTTYLRRYPDHHSASVESFLYWSKDVLDGGKPIISITHVSLIPAPAGPRPQTLVASTQVFATHYLSTSLSLIAVTNPAPGGEQYLVYTRRLRVDLLNGGIFSGLLRRLVEGRIRSDGPPVLDEIRRRLESGEPPADS